MRRYEMRRSRLSPICVIGLAVVCVAAPALAQTTPPEPAAAQPLLPSSAVVDSMVGKSQPPLEVRRRAIRRPVVFHRIGHHSHHYAPFERPALSGVTLVAPLPPPPEPPHIEVPLPAYPLDSLVTALITPPPPIVCHHVPRDPDAPDPNLYREATVACEPDNP